MLDKRIIFDERYDDEDYGTMTLYFIAPKEMLNGKYPEAEHMEISIEFPIGHIESNYASVAFSPSKNGEDYDWYDVDLPYDEIEEFIKLAEDNDKDKTRLKNLYKKLENIIDNMPDEEDCADEENEMYLYMVALRNSMENAGYGN